MSRTVLLLALIFQSFFLFGQNRDKINEIHKKFEKINSDTGYTIKFLDNEYFIDVKNETIDNGQELRGYFKNGEIRKIIYHLGLSYCMRTLEYYFSGNQLIFVFEREENYPEKKDSSGEFVGFYYSKLEPAFEGRYYINNGKIIQKKISGHKRFDESEDDNEAEEKIFLRDTNEFIGDLKGQSK